MRSQCAQNVTKHIELIIVVNIFPQKVCKISRSSQWYVNTLTVGEGYCNQFRSVCHSVSTPFCTYNSKPITSIELNFLWADYLIVWIHMNSVEFGDF